MCLQNAPPFEIMNKSTKLEPISIIFEVQIPEELSNQKIMNSPTRPSHLDNSVHL